MQVDFRVEDLGPERFRWLYQYWLDGREGEGLPPPGLIDPARIRTDILPFLGVMGQEPGGDRLKIRLAGSGIKEFTGLEFTGRFTDELPGAELADKRFHWCWRTGRPYALNAKVTWSPRDYQTYAVLALPFGDHRRKVERVVLLFEFV